MATSKLIFQLVNDIGQNPLNTSFGDSQDSQGVWLYGDWDLDGNGNIRSITQQEAMVQSTLKCLFTEKQDNGYGTNIYDIIGEKDIIVKRTSLLMDITMGVIALKSFNDAQAAAQDINPEDLIATITKMVIKEDPADTSKSIVTLALQSNAGTNVTVGVL